MEPPDRNKPSRYANLLNRHYTIRTSHLPNRELNVTLQSVVCGALAHPLEIDFLSNSDILASRLLKRERARKPNNARQMIRQAKPVQDASRQNSAVGESWDSPSEGEEALYGTSPPYNPRQMKRMSGKHQRSQARSAGRSPNKDLSPSGLRESPRPAETPEEHSYKQGKKQRATLRSTERDHKKTFEGSFMLDPLSKSTHFGSLNMDPRKHYLSLGCSSGKLPVSMPHIARTHRQTSRTDCPADRLKFFETLRLLLKLTSMSSKRKEKEQRGLENMAFMGHNNEVIWLELQAWHARRSTGDQDLFLFTARQAIPDIINEVLHFKSVERREEPAVAETNHCGVDPWGFSAFPSSAMNAAEPLGSGAVCREHLQRQRLAFEQVKHVIELLESVEALYPSLQALQKDYEKYAARDFQGRVQALCLWLNITQDLNQKLRVMATVLGLHDLSRIGWPVFEIPSPRCSRGNEEEDNEEDEENDSTATFTAESDGEDRDAEEEEEEVVVLGHIAEGELSPSLTPKFARLLSEDEFLPTANAVSAEVIAGGGVFCPTAIYRPFVDKALKQMGLRKLILRLHKLMDRSLQRSRAALLRHTPALELVRECKEVLKGGLLMKQYYQFMLRGVVTDAQGLQTNANIDEFEEDLHKMLVVYFDYMHSWIQMLQQLPQASHSLKNLLEEEWNFTKVITPYIRGGEAQSGKLFCDIAGMLLKSTGEFLDAGLQKSGNEFWETADDSTASDEIRRSVIETSRSLKELFHEARERASKALGFAKMLRKDLEVAADFSITNGVTCLLEALKKRNYVKVQIPGLEELQVFVPCGLMGQRPLILQLLNAAAGKDCSKEPDEIAEDEAYLLMSKHGAGDSTTDSDWAQWEGELLKLVPQMETVDTLRAMKVENVLLIVMQSAHLVAQRKAFQQSMEDVLTLSREQTSSQPLIASALEELKDEALQLCIKISTAIDRVEFMFTTEFEAEVEESESATLHQYYREAMIQGYNFAFEYHKEVVRLMSGEFRQRIGERYIAFARKWMTYVLTKCESGRGTKPRWATQGFDFLQAIEPGFISALPEDDFLNLQALMNECIGHVIGKPHSPVTGLYIAPRNSPRPVKVPRCHSDPPNPNLFIPNAEGFSSRSLPCDLRNQLFPNGPRPVPQGPGEQSNTKAPSSSPNDVRGSSFHENDRLSSVAAELHFKSLSRHSSPTEDREEPSYPKGDPNSTARRSWELRNFISQSKDTAARQSPMEAVRRSIRKFEDKRYAVMKQRNIIGQVCHTPKSYDNVMHVGLRKVTFKWQRGNKIGEGQYGKVYTCINVDTGELMAMKEIRFQPNDHKTIKETADELKIFEGIKHPNLVRYFGVELHRHTWHLKVITRAKGEGHGRAADIWSLGCVLIEMVTGKRPWHEYEHNFQIMYKVGMGHKPPIPEKLSTEGKDFLGHCLESEPKRRWTASMLLDHPFVKVCTDEE
ncbi:Mitogen-activated protein kinase kinase kinase 4 [Collichthys lucidus]|uniref:Mitogen-activated protein kinase kinase kinase 4 n=1 Tax=Collichthys lucidus TaxID=240159 RepID=A0A4U5VBH8_COLLU|nr:Mitogen-activated protein kinase kinase kinase 4 [Collichthys lucidus]